MTIVPTAPTYLFWRCAPPELRVPATFIRALGRRGGRTVAVGPHGVGHPGGGVAEAGRGRGGSGRMRGGRPRNGRCRDWSSIGSLAVRRDDTIAITGGPAACRFTDLPALRWPDAWVARHHHHHHRFDNRRSGRARRSRLPADAPTIVASAPRSTSVTSTGAAICRSYWRRSTVCWRRACATSYFIDEIFLPQRPLLEALAQRDVAFGVQTRIDLWKPDMLRLLGTAGCVSIEAGIESLTAEGRATLAKRCRLETEDLARLLIEARRHVPFVQANLIGVDQDDASLVEHWRSRLIGRRRLGQRAGAAVSLSQFARVIARSGASRTTRRGSAPTNIICAPSPASATSRTSGQRRCRFWRLRAAHAR